MVTLIGANAAGKTTALRAIMGLKELTAGAIRFNGIDVSRIFYGRAGATRARVITRGTTDFPKFTVEENLLIGG